MDGQNSAESPNSNTRVSREGFCLIPSSTTLDNMAISPEADTLPQTKCDGSRPIHNRPSPTNNPISTTRGRPRFRDDELSLPSDYHIPANKYYAQETKASQSLLTRIYQHLFSTKPLRGAHLDDSTMSRQPTETSPLLGPTNAHVIPGAGDEPNQNAERPLASSCVPAWQREAKLITSCSVPLIVTCLLQYSINLSGVFTAGRLGKFELGAVSLANTTVVLSCLAPLQGLATSLDTLCSQAYGSGYKRLVGLQCQRMVSFLFCLAVPIAVLWGFSEHVFLYIVPDAESARLAGLYLRIMILGLPGLILFETGKRFFQAQGLFNATTHIMLIAAPINILLNWLCVYRLRLGFLGAPIAISITQNVMAILLVLYVRFINGSQCWGGLDSRAFSNWWLIIRLALPGMIMVEAEWLAFHIVTILASRFGTEYLAAQSVLITLMTVSFQIPFSLSIAASTRVANLIGAGLTDAAKLTAKVSFAMACILGLLNLTIYITLRCHLALLFSSDKDVIALVSRMAPLVAVTQLCDSLSIGAHGLLRGLGRQYIGGLTSLFSYYAIALPIALSLAFALDWKLAGMWIGLTLGLFIVGLIEYTYAVTTSWSKAAMEAATRNAAC